MRKFRTFGVIAAMTAAAAVPMVGSSFAGAQDAGACGDGGVAASQSSSNTGGLIGSLLPIDIQAVAPVNAPVTSPNQCTANSNTNSVGGGGGGGSHAGGAGGGGVGGAVPAGAVGGAPRFAG
jgi:hypothetical protein